MYLRVGPVRFARLRIGLCICAHMRVCVCAPAPARRILHRHEANSLVESTSQRATLGEERVRGNDKWPGHASRN